MKKIRKLSPAFAFGAARAQKAGRFLYTYFTHFLKLVAAFLGFPESPDFLG
jgi:hypothetical protein